MGTQVTHEPPNPTTPPENLSVPPGSSTPETIPPTNPPADGAIDPKYVKLLEGSLAETSRRLQEVENERARGSATPPPPPPDPERERSEFYNNPKESTRQLIREELESSVGEIREFVRSFKGASAIDKLVERFAVDPRFKSMWDSSVEAYVREQAAGVPPANLNDQTFGFLVVSAIGLKATGMLSASSPAATPPAPPAPTPTPAPAPGAPSPTPTPMPTPPHMRPSPPPGAPPTQDQPAQRPLTELEQRLLREYNAGKPKEKQMDEKQFLIWQTMPAADVAFSTLGQPKT